MTSADLAVQRSPDSPQPVSKPSAWQAGFIASPAYDLFFFILSPLMALTIILSLDVANSTWSLVQGSLFGKEGPILLLFIGTWTYAHLFAVVFRSHANTEIFKRFWPRFVIVPSVLFLILFSDAHVRSIGFVIGAFWDVYHTSMQNFGFCRIYDSKLGNPPEKGRLLDIWLNHLVYIGPIFIGLSFRNHLEFLKALEPHGWDTGGFTEAVLSIQGPITNGILIVGGAFVAYYIYAYRKLSLEGYRISPQKIVLVISTAIGSIWAWSFLYPLEAFFVANFFHGLQYFAIVWCQERRTLTKTLRVSRVAGGSAIAFVCFLAVVTSMGIWLKVMGTDQTIVWAACVALVISLMHFWYDGFIWSVRKQQL